MGTVSELGTLQKMPNEKYKKRTMNKLGAEKWNATKNFQ